MQLQQGRLYGCNVVRVHTHTHKHTNLIVCVDTSDTVGNDSARFLLDTLFYFSNIHDVKDAELHRVFFFVSLFLYKSGQ